MKKYLVICSHGYQELPWYYAYIFVSLPTCDFMQMSLSKAQQLSKALNQTSSRGAMLKENFNLCIFAIKIKWTKFGVALNDKYTFVLF